MGELNYYFLSGKRKKYVKRFYDDPSDYNKDLLNDEANESTKLVVQVKEQTYD